MNAAANTGRQNPDQPGRSIETIQQCGHAINKNSSYSNVKEIDKCSANIDRKHKSQIHHQQKDRQTENSVENNFVNLVGQRLAQLAGVRHSICREPVDKTITGVCNGNISIFF